jgi:hypothetical protein
LTGFNTVIPSLRDDAVHVIAGGQGYEVDPRRRYLHSVFGGSIEIAVTACSQGLLIMGDGIRLEAWVGHDLRWQSRRISWDGMRNVRVEGDKIAGEAWSPVDDCYCPFTVDLATGRVEGVSYNGPD